MNGGLVKRVSPNDLQIVRREPLIDSCLFQDPRPRREARGIRISRDGLRGIVNRAREEVALDWSRIIRA